MSSIHNRPTGKRPNFIPDRRSAKSFQLRGG